MSKWKESFSFLTPSGVVHKVGGQDYTFYPISMGKAFALRGVAEPVVKALTVLFVKSDNDTGSIDRIVPQGNAAAREIVSEAITPALAEMRSKLRQSAVADAIKALMAPDAMHVFGEIIKDSLCDQFKRGDTTAPPGSEVFAAFPSTVMPDVIVGVVKANKGVFGPLAVAVEHLFDGLKKQVEARVAEQMQTTPSEIGGETSKTESSTAPNGATGSNGS